MSNISFMRLICIFILSLFLSTEAFADVRPFTKRAINGQLSTNLTGNLLLIGNQLLCQNDFDGDTCTAPTVGVNNNSINQHKADVDSDASTTSSSMARLDINTTDTVVWARLYWSARLNDPTSTEKTNSKTIKFRTPASATYNTITAENYDFYPSDDPYDYGASADVTALVKAGRGGQYFAADIEADNGSNQFASWSLLVIVSNPTRTLNNISVYDGFEVLYDGGGYPDQVSITASDFLTPKSGAVNSKLFLYSGESEAQLNDSASITNKAGTVFPLVDAQNTATDIFNASISTSGVYRSSFRVTDPTLADPNFQNVVGTDIDVIDITQLDNEQSSTVITIKSFGNSDKFSLNMFAFETELYEPRFCYDYAYEQNGRYFTEENLGGTNLPRLTGTVLPGEDINMTIYIRNEENSDVVAKNMEINVTNIDTTQARYKTNTTRVTQPGAFASVPVDEADISTGPSYVKGVQIDDVDGQQFFYLFYTLDTSALNGNDINMSIEAQISYNLVLPTPDGGDITIATTSNIGGFKVPMCSLNGLRYLPNYGRYNVEHAANYTLYPSPNHVYNLPTQVAGRPDTFKVVSYNPDNLDERNATSTTVFVELIDAGSQADVQAACDREEASISERIFVGFRDTESVDFDKDYILAHSLDVTKTPEQFFGEAHENVLFRITYNVLNDENESLVDSEYIDGTGWVIHNFNELAQGVVNANLDLPVNEQNKCRDDVEYSYYLPNGNIKTEVFTTMPQACGNNADTNGMTDIEMAICMQCVFGYNTKKVCSRDNFSTRPEAFNINIYDNNESTLKTDPAILLPKNAKIAAGYKYSYDINATSHTGNEPAIGYTQDFRVPRPDFNLSYVWSPEPLRDVSGCNDTKPKHPPVYIRNGLGINDPLVNGVVVNNSNDTIQNKSNNVGRYQFSMIDTVWTGADQNPYHHSLAKYSAHFLQGSDCAIGQSFVPDGNQSLINTSVGCNISSTHRNNDADITYTDYNISIRPYAFDISRIAFQKGHFDLNLSMPRVDLDKNNSFVYQNNIIKDSDDFNMSVRFIGTLLPVGYDFNQTGLSNFVKDCYAEDLDLNVSTDPIPVVNAPQYQYRLRELDAASTIVLDDNNSGWNVDENNVTVNSLSGLITLPAKDFNKSMSGSVNMELHLNFGRSVTTPFNPIFLTYNDFNVSCKTRENCESQAEMKRPDLGQVHDVNGTYTIFNPSYKAAPLNIAHLYGREHIPRYRVNGNNAQVPIYYEFFCDDDAAAQPAPCNIATFANFPDANRSISPKALLSVDDVRWYVQLEHNVSADGNATSTQTRDLNGDRVGEDNGRFGLMDIDDNSTTANYVYNGSRGYPYKATIEVVTPDWLIFSRYDGSDTVNNKLAPGSVVNNFELEFTQSGGRVGKDTSGINTQTDSASTTNRRIQW